MSMVASTTGCTSGSAAYTESARLAACFGGAAGAGLGRQLLASARVKGRLPALISSRYSLPSWVEPEACDGLDRAIALRPAAELEKIVRRAGAIYWSAPIANVVLTQDVKALHEQIGEENYRLAVKHRDLTGANQSLAPAGTFRERMIADGWRCFAAWCDTLPPGAGTRVRLKFPASALLDTAASAPFDKRGPAIVRRAASSDE